MPYLIMLSYAETNGAGMARQNPLRRGRASEGSQTYGILSFVLRYFGQIPFSRQ